MLAFPQIPDQATPGSNTTGGKASWRQSDIRRAIDAAERAGLRSYRIEISPDGTISIVVGSSSE